VQITTKRLQIRDFIFENWFEVYTYASNPEVVKYLAWGPNSQAETKELMHQKILMQQQNPRLNFDLAITLKETGQLAGGCSLDHDGQQGEIGYCLNPEYWGGAYASEAAAAMIDFGFRGLGLHRITATCRPDNIGSVKVMEKVGMKREGHLREHVWYKGKWHDSYLYAILGREW
jgi:ribosomal-protein-alanine N-acetyltransferase